MIMIGLISIHLVNPSGGFWSDRFHSDTYPLENEDKMMPWEHFIPCDIGGSCGTSGRTW